MDFENLNEKTLTSLREIAKELGVRSVTTYHKQMLIEKIMEARGSRQANSTGEVALENAAVLASLPEDDDQIEAEEGEEADSDEETLERKGRTQERSDQTCEGILELHPDGYGFLRSNHYDTGPDDTYVSMIQIRRFKLKTGDYVTGITREAREKEKFGPLIYIQTVNGYTPGEAWRRTPFEELTPIYPIEKVRLEWQSKELSTRLIDLISPIGKGQRGLIVSPPKAGKTTLLKSIANAIEHNHPEMKVIVLLIDERPEEVTDMRRSVKGDVVASTFDEIPENHVRISEFVLERAKRLVEHGEDVVILLDSITRLSRAYNITVRPSGRTLSGGLDPVALHKPKWFFGAARKMEGGGSLTILATALVDTGSRMDDMIYEEFKGTGNMEIHLDRNLSEMRVFPAIDLFKSGTRRDDLLLSAEERRCMYTLRKAQHNRSNYDSVDTILRLMTNSDDNREFMGAIEKQLAGR